jgi:hypothetical protein
LEEVVNEIMKVTRHKLVICTNLSAEISRIQEVLNNIPRGRLKWLIATFNPQYVQYDIFRDKVMSLNSYLKRIDSKVVVHIVAVKEIFSAVSSYASEFKASQIDISILPDKNFFGNKDYYSGKQKTVMRNFGREFGLNNTCFKNKYCLSGKYHFVIDARGDAFRCVNAKKGQSGYLGSLINDSFRLYQNAVKCEYQNCHCVVAVSNNLIIQNNSDLSPIPK